MNKDLYGNGKRFGLFIKKIRTEHNMSRSFVAKRLKLNSQSSVMNFETGHTSMSLKYISAFIEMLPMTMTLPVFMAMYEIGTSTPPCSCICHHDLNDSIPSIYIEGVCQLCLHQVADGQLQNGLWFAKA